MRLRSRKRERPLQAKSTSKITKRKTTPLLAKRLRHTPKTNWTKTLKRESKNVTFESKYCITRSQTNLKTRPVRTRLIQTMEKPVETHKGKSQHKDDGRTKKPIFQTVVRSCNKDPVSSTTSLKLDKKTQNEKVTTTAKTKPKEIRSTKSVQLRVNSLNRELRCKTEVLSSDRISSPRKTRRLDKTDKSASLNSSPIRKVRQIGLPSPKITKATVSSTNESPKKKSKPKAATVPTPEHPNWVPEDNDITMYEAHTTMFVELGYTPKTSDESDSDVHVETSDLCLSNDCLNEFIAIADCGLVDVGLAQDDADVNFLADKAARVMTATENEDDSKKVWKVSYLFLKMKFFHQ